MAAKHNNENIEGIGNQAKLIAYLDFDNVETKRMDFCLVLFVLIIAN